MRQTGQVYIFWRRGRIFDALLVEGVALLAPRSDRRLGGARAFWKHVFFSIGFHTKPSGSFLREKENSIV